MFRRVLQPLLRGAAPRRAVAGAAGPTGAEELVLSEVGADGVALVTLNHAAKFNALTVACGERFARVVAALAADPAVRAVVLTGAGAAFSAGGDLEFLHARIGTDPVRNSEEMRRFYARFLSLRALPVPTIAAINGPAIGAGCCVATACDLRIAAASARLGYTFATLGIHPGMAATHFLPQHLGMQQAARLLLTGEVITGTEAARIGLVLEAVPTEDVLPKALALARSIAKASPVAVRTCVKSLRSGRRELSDDQ
jgi:enoyl-CoA hydratase/carnithine racemase